ncbi:MAG: DUF4277 domain-containing protein [Thermoplasmata archaeon]
MTRPEDLSLAHEMLGAVPLVDHFLDRLDPDTILQEEVPSSSLVELPWARALGVFVRNFILDRGPVYALEERTVPFAPELFRLAPDQVRLLNDDRAGRALDALFDADRATLLNRLVIRAVREFHLDLNELHNDSTTITFTGEYPEADGRWIRGKPTVALRRSLSNKDHRPDLKQVLWNLTVTFDGAVPVRCQWTCYLPPDGAQATSGSPPVQTSEATDELRYLRRTGHEQDEHDGHRGGPSGPPRRLVGCCICPYHYPSATNARQP